MVLSTVLNILLMEGVSHKTNQFSVCNLVHYFSPKIRLLWNRYVKLYFLLFLGYISFLSSTFANKVFYSHSKLRLLTKLVLCPQKKVLMLQPLHYNCSWNSGPLLNPQCLPGEILLPTSDLECPLTSLQKPHHAAALFQSQSKLEAVNAAFIIHWQKETLGLVKGWAVAPHPV